jgi:aspartokinase
VAEQKDRSTTEKTAMEGLRVSGHQSLMEVADRSYAGERLSRMLGELAVAGVNMNLFIGGETKEEIRFACCVAASEEAHIKALMDPNPEFRTGVELTPAVDQLTLFPHRSELKILGLGLTALARARIPLHGFCSSLSAITFVTDHTDLDQAIAALEGCFGLVAETCGSPC